MGELEQEISDLYDTLVEEYFDLGRLPPADRETARLLVAYSMADAAMLLYTMRPGLDTWVTASVSVNEALRGVWVQA